MLTLYAKFIDWLNNHEDDVTDGNGNRNSPWYKWLTVMVIFVIVPGTALGALLFTVYWFFLRPS